MEKENKVNKKSETVTVISETENRTDNDKVRQSDVQGVEENCKKGDFSAKDGTSCCGEAVKKAMTLREAFLAKGISMYGSSMTNQQFPILTDAQKETVRNNSGIDVNKSYVDSVLNGKQDALTSGTNIKTVNGQSLLGSGDIAISGGGGDVTAAGDNTFTGNNVFSGIAIADILDGTQYQITGDNGVLMFASGATNDDIQLSGVATPTYSNSAANKSYVDSQISTALGTVLTQLQNI